MLALADQETTDTASPNENTLAYLPISILSTSTGLLVLLLIGVVSLVLSLVLKHRKTTRENTIVETSPTLSYVSINEEVHHIYDTIDETCTDLQERDTADNQLRVGMNNVIQEVSSTENTATQQTSTRSNSESYSIAEGIEMVQNSAYCYKRCTDSPKHESSNESTDAADDVYTSMENNNN